ncbi:MAG TPA: hypothetical protein VGM05_29775, partial [Planctomycetaceae bacterium]
ATSSKIKDPFDALRASKATVRASPQPQTIPISFACGEAAGRRRVAAAEHVWLRPWLRWLTATRQGSAYRRPFGIPECKALSPIWNAICAIPMSIIAQDTRSPATTTELVGSAAEFRCGLRVAVKQFVHSQAGVMRL